MILIPYKSAKQRAFMHAKHPDIAARWDAEYGGKIKGKSSGQAERKGKARSRGKVRRSR